MRLQVIQKINDGGVILNHAVLISHIEGLIYNGKGVIWGNGELFHAHKEQEISGDLILDSSSPHDQLSSRETPQIGRLSALLRMRKTFACSPAVSSVRFTIRCVKCSQCQT